MQSDRSYSWRQARARAERAAYTLTGSLDLALSNRSLRSRGIMSLCLSKVILAAAGKTVTEHSESSGGRGEGGGGG